MVFFVGFAGCALFGEKERVYIHETWSEEYLIRQTRMYIKNNEFESALKTVAGFPSTMRAQALFQKGIVYASAANPQRDMEKSAACFRLLIHQYPDSMIYNQALLFFNLIKDCLAMATCSDELIDKNYELIGSNNTLEQKNVSLEKTSQVKERQIKLLRHQVDLLKEQLQKLKEIDLGIENENGKLIPK